jgi:hypothetical protein
MDGWIGGGSWGAAELLLVSDSHLGVAHNTLVVRWIPRKSLLKCFATIFESATLKKKIVRRERYESRQFSRVKSSVHIFRSSSICSCVNPSRRCNKYSTCDERGVIYSGLSGKTKQKKQTSTSLVNGMIKFS